MKTMKRILVLLVLLASGVILSACGEDMIKITATAYKTIAGETVALIPEINTKKAYTLSWYSKTEAGEWTDTGKKTEILYVIDHYGGKYSYKAVLNVEEAVRKQCCGSENGGHHRKDFGPQPNRSPCHLQH